MAVTVLGSALPTAGEVYALIRARGHLTRSEVGRLAGLSRTAVAARVSALIGLGLVEESEPAPSTGGRPAAYLSIAADAGVVLAAAVGRSRTQLAVCDLSGRTLAASILDQEPGLAPDDLMPDVVKGLDALLRDSGRDGARIFGVGLSLPGTVDQARGAVSDSPVMSGWDGVPLRPYFAELTDAPVILDNDVNVIAGAERAPGGPDLDDLLVLKASTGLGLGIIAGGVLQRGATAAAGEFGHNKVAAAAGIPCRCGDVGCVEAIAGGWAVVRDLRRAGRQVAHVRDVVEQANGGDAEARRMIRDSGRHVGAALASAVNLLNPAALVISGDLAGAYDVYVAGLRETLYRDATALATRELQVIPSAFGDRAGLIGSAAVALDRVLSPAAIDAAVAQWQP